MHRMMTMRHWLLTGDGLTATQQGPMSGLIEELDNLGMPREVCFITSHTDTCGKLTGGGWPWLQ